jgi:hypothetical protein
MNERIPAKIKKAFETEFRGQNATGLTLRIRELKIGEICRIPMRPNQTLTTVRANCYLCATRIKAKIATRIVDGALYVRRLK